MLNSSMKRRGIKANRFNILERIDNATNRLAWSKILFKKQTQFSYIHHNKKAFSFHVSRGSDECLSTYVGDMKIVVSQDMS